MNKRTRDVLFILFIILFILMSGFASLYASGYKFNFRWPLEWNRILQKTGMVNIATTPRGAYVFIDERPQKRSAFSLLKKDYLSTPVRIKNILPGEYLLRLEKDNYWPIEKRVSVQSGQTTFLEDVNLFRSDLPLLLIPASEDRLLLSSSRRYLYLPGQGKIINLRTDSQHELIVSEDENGQWMKNSDKIFSAGKIIDVEKNNILDLTTTIGATSASWKYNEIDDRIYYSDADSISRLEGDQRSVSTILRGEAYLNYEARGDNIFSVIKEGERVFLRGYKLGQAEKVGELELPAYGNYGFKKSNSKYLSLYDELNSTLYLINVLDWQNSAVIKDARDWSWINDDELIYSNGWEIGIFNLTSKQSTILTRASEESLNVLWHNSGRYFIFSSGTSLQIGDPKNKTIITIFRAEKIGPPILDERNNLLYFYAKVGQQEGVYKLLLQ